MNKALNTVFTQAVGHLDEGIILQDVEICHVMKGTNTTQLYFVI
jgi:hypothetical protein